MTLVRSKIIIFLSTFRVLFYFIKVTCIFTIFHCSMSSFILTFLKQTNFWDFSYIHSNSFTFILRGYLTWFESLVVKNTLINCTKKIVFLQFNSTFELNKNRMKSFSKRDAIEAFSFSTQEISGMNWVVALIQVSRWCYANIRYKLLLEFSQFILAETIEINAFLFGRWNLMPSGV